MDANARRKIMEQRLKGMRSWSDSYKLPDHKPGEYSTLRIVRPDYLPDEFVPWLEGKEYQFNGGTKEFKCFDSPSFYGCPDPLADAGAQARQTYRCFVIDLDDVDSGLQEWKFGVAIARKITECALDKRSNPDFWDVDEGHNIEIRKTKPSPNKTEFNVTFSAACPLEDGAKWQELANARDLTASIKVDTPEILSKYMETGQYDYEEAGQARADRDNTDGKPCLPFCGTKQDKPKVKAGKPAGKVPAKSVKQPEPEPEPEPEDESGFYDAAAFPVGSPVEFDTDDGPVIGTVSCVLEHGAYCTVTDSDDGEWKVPTESLRKHALPKATPVKATKAAPVKAAPAKAGAPTTPQERLAALQAKFGAKKAGE